jgi:hypothetical protein
MFDLMKKNTTYLIALILCTITVLSIPSIILFGVINPGFEGAKCYFYGSYFPSASWSGYVGTDTLHKYQDAEAYLIKYTGSEGLGTRINTVPWTTLATPNDAGMGFESRLKYALGGQDEVKCMPDLGVHVESNIQLQDINRQGDPLGWNDTNPMDAQRIEYWSKTAVKEETAGKVLYHYTLTKESFIVAPAEFWVGFYLVPSQTDANTGSGWREGEYNNIVVWFMLDWTVWDNAYKDPWLDDPKINVFTSEHEGQNINEQRQWTYRGGFPITGWIQGWEKGGWQKMAWEEGAVSNSNAESPSWLQTRGTENVIYTPEELADLKDILMAKCSFAPSLIGQFISLYNEPSASFDYEPQLYEGSTFPTDTVTDYVKTPDSRMKKTMYFPINILNFGTYADPTSHVGPIVTGWRIFYPSCYFRIRTLYGVYGKFTYLWTEELAKDPNINYPSEPERHETTVIHVAGFDLGTWWQGVNHQPIHLLMDFHNRRLFNLSHVDCASHFRAWHLHCVGGTCWKKEGKRQRIV